MLKKPQNVYLPIDKFQAKVFKHRDDAKKGEWVTNFALALAEEADDPFAKSLLEKAQVDLYKDMVRSWRFNAKKALVADGVKEPNEMQIHKKCAEDYGEEYADAIELLARSSKRIRKNLEKNLSADGDTREDSQDVPDCDNAASLESATSADTKIAGPAKNSYGEFGNVKMTTEEFSKLVQAEGADRANALIEELSSYMASSGKRYKSHYATLLNWGRRKDKEGEPKQKFMTADDISRRNIEESKRQLDALMAHRRASNG